LRVRLGRGRGALGLFILLFFLLFLLVQFRQLNLNLATLCLGRDQDFEDSTMDLVKQLNRGMCGGNQHSFNIVVKGERVQLENLTVDVQCVPGL
jgi:hypothetical protein